MERAKPIEISNVRAVKSSSLRGMTFMLVLLASATSAAQTSPQVVVNPNVRSVSVNGSCLRSVQPDRGSITVTSQHQDPDLQKAAKRAAESYEKLRQAVMKLNLKNAELNTSEYDLGEVREWEKDKQVSKGFRARMGLTVTTSETSRLGEIIAIAGQLGLREVSRLQTFLSPERQKAEREACLEEATRNARSKADAIAKAAAAKVVRVLTVVEGTQNANEAQPYYAKMEMAGAAADRMAPPNVEASNVKISVEVSATFSLE